MDVFKINDDDDGVLDKFQETLEKDSRIWTLDVLTSNKNDKINSSYIT